MIISSWTYGRGTVLAWYHVSYFCEYFKKGKSQGRTVCVNVDVCPGGKAWDSLEPRPLGEVTLLCQGHIHSFLLFWGAGSAGGVYMNVPL